MKSDDIRILRDIEQYYSTQIDEMPMNGKMQLSDFECFQFDSTKHCGFALGTIVSSCSKEWPILDL